MSISVGVYVLSLIDVCVVVVQAWVTISSKSPVMVLQEHLSLQMLVVATAVMVLMLNKQAMGQVPMERERILEEGPPMFLVDSIHMDAKELEECFVQKIAYSEITKFQNCVHRSLAFQEILGTVLYR